MIEIMMPNVFEIPVYEQFKYLYFLRNEYFIMKICTYTIYDVKPKIMTKIIKSN